MGMVIKYDKMSFFYIVSYFLFYYWMIFSSSPVSNQRVTNMYIIYNFGIVFDSSTRTRWSVHVGSIKGDTPTLRSCTVVLNYCFVVN